MSGPSKKWHNSCYQMSRRGRSGCVHGSSASGRAARTRFYCTWARARLACGQGWQNVQQPYIKKGSLGSVQI